MKHVCRKNKSLSNGHLMTSLITLLIVILFSGHVRAEGVDALFIDEKGNVGIGNTEPKAPLDVTGNAVISGQVGIGTTNPTEKLEVSGSIKADKFINSDGQVLVPIPVGGIIMWSGHADQIPNGWALCDGSNNTPDLRGRFVLGSNSSSKDYTQRKIGETGGEEEHMLTITEMPEHSHDWLQGMKKGVMGSGAADKAAV